MKHFLTFSLSLLLLASCKPVTPEPTQPKEPEGTTVTFTETDEIFANPERGFHSQIYYTSGDLNKVASASTINSNRESSYKLTLYLHSYYLTDYIESDIPQEFLDRLDQNMQALRDGGAKAVIRFSYKSSMDRKDKPWNASAEWISRHIDQVAPYLMKNADVIFCIQCGWLGSWGEWYYVDSGFKFNPSRDEDFEPRWELVEHFMNVTPKDRQIAFRTPGYKIRYLKMRGDSLSSPLTAEEAYKPTIKARWAGHNDCFVASNNDVGTYFSTAERTFWQEDTKYTVMGGETCGECAFSNGENAVKQMELTHWTYINRDYHSAVISSWITDNHMNEIKRRLGYRLAIDKIIVTPAPKVGEKLDVYFQLHNSGFAAPVNKRDVELILVSTADASKKYVYPQSVDPRFWLPGEDHRFTLTCNPEQAGEYKVYLNLPDPYESLHDDPRFSIRLANMDCWDKATGYNYLTTVTIE